MALLRKNKKEIYFERVIAYGCSFTVGEETADYYVRPELTLDQIDEEKKAMGMENWLRTYLTPSKAVDPRRKKDANENSWANQLAAMFDVPCINNAESGNSMECIIYDIEQDLFNKKIKDTDVIFVGCTSMPRWLWIDEKAEIRRVLLTQGLYDWPSQELHDAIVKNANDFWIFYKYAMCLRHLDLLSSRLDNRLLLFNCHFDIVGNIGYIKRVRKNKEFRTFIESLAKNDAYVDEKFSFTSFINWGVGTHGGLHPKKHHHTKFAEHFYNLLKV